MASEHKRSRWRKWVAILGLLVLYILSVGPAAWVCQKINPTGVGWSWEVLDVLYTPVIYAARWTGTTGMLTDYAEWFVS